MAAKGQLCSAPFDVLVGSVHCVAHVVWALHSMGHSRKRERRVAGYVPAIDVFRQLNGGIELMRTIGDGRKAQGCAGLLEEGGEGGRGVMKYTS